MGLEKSNAEKSIEKIVFTKYIADQGHTVDLVTSKELIYDNVNVIKISFN